MPAQRSRGDGGLHWDESRQRWIATATLGYGARGKRITRKAGGKTKSEAKKKLTEILRDHEDSAFRKVLAGTSLDAAQWTPREPRRSFVSLLSDAGLPVEKISRLVGHADTTTTETVYRFQIRPVIQDGATAMDEIFPQGEDGKPAPPE